MKLEHLRAMVWLRWTLMLRTWRRGGPVGTLVAVLFAVAAVVTALTGFFLAFGLGLLLLRGTEPVYLPLVWDGVIGGFLFMWAIGVMTELQRSEPLSLTKLLHLPVSVSSAFFLNYAASWVCLSMVVWLPLMIGLALASAVVFGVAGLVLLAPVLALMLMVTALTHQLRGWLAALMADKRRRGTVIAVVTMTFVLIVNLPGLAGMYLDRDDESGSPESSEEAPDEDGELPERYLTVARTANRVVPPAWLAYAAEGAGRGDVLPALLATVGMVGIAGVSLRRGYRSTLELYRRGGSGARPRAARRKGKDASRLTVWLDGLVGRELPFVPPQAAAIATSSLRILIRAPYVKMVLLTPAILFVVFGSMLATGRAEAIPPNLQPLLGLAAIGLAMLSVMQQITNVFGFDGDGFRVFVLGAAPRWEILLGKNLAHAPLAVGLGLVGLALLQVLVPVRASHFLAALVQLPCLYLICCLVGNINSILAPMAVSSGTMQPARPGVVTVLKQIAFALLVPVVAAPTTLPLGVELLAGRLGDGSPPPLYLLLSLVELPLVAWVYLKALRPEGELLALRERRILDVVTQAD